MTMHPTIPRLADEMGIPHAEARRIACREFPALRHFHKSQPLLGHQVARLRPLYLEVRRAPVAPMQMALIPKPEEDETMDGMTLSLISMRTGLGESKLKMLVSRHAELQEAPYSSKAGGSRIYFPPFIEWLKKYEGASASHESHNGVTSVTPKLPSGAQLRELRLAVKAGILDPSDPRLLLGLSPRQAALPSAWTGSALDALAGATFQAAGSGVTLSSEALRKAQDAGIGAFAGALKRAIAQTTAEAMQEKLF